MFVFFLFLLVLSPAFFSCTLFSLSTSRHAHNVRHTANALYWSELGRSLTAVSLSLSARDLVRMGTYFRGLGKVQNKDRITQGRRKERESRGKEIENEWNRLQLREEVFGKDPYRVENVDVGFVDMEVMPRTVMNILSGRVKRGTPEKKMLMSENESLMWYLTGHGGNGFFKFHDFDEITAEDIAWTVRHMWLTQRYKYLWIVADTCQAASLCSLIESPNVSMLFFLLIF